MDSSSAGRFQSGLLVVALLAAALTAATGGSSRYAVEQAEMVSRLRQHGVGDERVLAAMRQVPRHVFASASHRSRAYEDRELSVGNGQVLQSPLVVARALQALELRRGYRVLQVGAGCGYCTSLLCEITRHVHTVDIHHHAVSAGKASVESLGYTSVRWRTGKACEGWNEYAPFDAILVMCAAPEVPKDLVEQLKDGGRMVIPVIPVSGGPEQTLTRLTKSGPRLRSEVIMQVRMDPMACQRE